MKESRLAAKILPLPLLRRALANHRSRGRSIALANGVFDLLHVGHVRYLRAASRRADILVVAVNGDASVRALKGPGRPLLPERGRAEILAALEGVDYVTIFRGKSADEVIEALAPDVHCKGTDYTPGTVPERETVRRRGGRVVIAGDPKHHATRDLIHRVLSRAGALSPTPSRTSPRYQRPRRRRSTTSSSPPAKSGR